MTRSVDVQIVEKVTSLLCSQLEQMGIELDTKQKHQAILMVYRLLKDDPETPSVALIEDIIRFCQHI